MIRYLRAFWIALKITLTGQAVLPNSPRPTLSAWVLAGLKHLDTLDSALSPQQREIRLRIDGRDTRLDVLLRAMRHAWQTEYPYLIHHVTKNNLAVIEAAHFNHAYWVEKMLAAPALQNTPVIDQLQQLSKHLSLIPLRDDA